jgi:hypothetical protein
MDHTDGTSSTIASTDESSVKPMPDDTDYLYPVVIIKARYGGIYEGAQWLAFNDEPEHLTAVLGDDGECGAFFEGGYHGPIGRGATPQEAYDSLDGREQREAHVG